MSVSFEQPHSVAEGNWSEYMFELGDLAEREQWDDLEELLLMPHPPVPGELEAYKELVAGLAKIGRQARVQIDPTNTNHIISAENH